MTGDAPGPARAQARPAEAVAAEAVGKPVGKVVVTGGCGMLGGNLLARLAEDRVKTVSVDLAEPAPWSRAIDHVRADIRDTARMAEAFEGADAVVHCAGALPSYPAPQIRSIIVEGTESVLAAAKRAGVPRVVHISSTAVYGLPKIVPTPETHPAAPVDNYGAAKADAEAACLRYRDAGMCVPIIRPKTFLGPGRMGLFAMLFEWAEEGRNFPVLGRGDALIQMLAVEDLLDAVVAMLALPEDVACDTYNIAAADFGPIRESFQAVLDTAGHGGHVVGIPARPALATLRMLEGMRLSPVYGRLLHKLLGDSYVSIDHAAERFGFVPRFSSRDAILNTFHWWRGLRAAAGPDSPGTAGVTSRDAWSQGLLRAAKVLF